MFQHLFILDLQMQDSLLPVGVYICLRRPRPQTHTCVPVLQTCVPDSLCVAKCGSLVVAPYLAFFLDRWLPHSRVVSAELLSPTGLTGQASPLQVTSLHRCLSFQSLLPGLYLPPVARRLTS